MVSRVHLPFNPRKWNLKDPKRKKLKNKQENSVSVSITKRSVDTGSINPKIPITCHYKHFIEWCKPKKKKRKRNILTKLQACVKCHAESPYQKQSSLGLLWLQKYHQKTISINAHWKRRWSHKLHTSKSCQHLPELFPMANKSIISHFQ